MSLPCQLVETWNESRFFLWVRNIMSNRWCESMPTKLILITLRDSASPPHWHADPDGLLRRSNLNPHPSSQWVAEVTSCHGNSSTWARNPSASGLLLECVNTVGRLTFPHPVLVVMETWWRLSPWRILFLVLTRVRLFTCQNNFWFMRMIDHFWVVFWPDNGDEGALSHEMTN